MTFAPHSAAAYALAYRDALVEAEALVKPLTPEQFNWKPSSEEWSVAECIDHLNKTGRAYLPVFEKALEKGGPAGAPPFRYGFFGRQFIHATSPEGKRKIKTFASITPDASGCDVETVMATFREVTATFIRFCKRADGLDLRRIRLASPLLPVVRLQLGAFLEALAGHEMRHLAQARRVTQRSDFPR